MSTYLLQGNYRNAATIFAEPEDQPVFGKLDMLDDETDRDSEPDDESDDELAAVAPRAAAAAPLAVDSDDEWLHAADGDDVEADADEDEDPLDPQRFMEYFEDSLSWN